MVTVLNSFFRLAFTENQVAAAKLEGKPFGEFKAAADRYIEVYQRNPALLYTKEYKEVIQRLRTLLSLFASRLKAAAKVSTGEALENVEVVMHSSMQYVRNLRKMIGSEVLANAHELVAELGKLDLPTRVAALELTSQLALISQLEQEGMHFQDIRGNERELKKIQGTATKHRLQLEKTMIRLFQTIIPAAYLMYTPDTASHAALKEVIFNINSVLDDYRHLVPGKGADGHIIPAKEEIPELPDDPEGVYI
jgi:hypothetical protein